MKITGLFVVWLMAFLLIWAPPDEGQAAPARPLRVAATTTAKVSGILDRLHEAFEKRSGVRVHMIAVGTGKAIRVARSGDADVLLVHSPEAEEKFVRDGYGVMRRLVMSNFFVIAGPEADPARAGGMKDGAAALRRIARSRALFFSRGDDSGTHRKELALWKAAGLVPGGGWYQSVGQGMGETLRIADEKRGYVLTDQSSFLKLLSKKRIDLRIHVAGDKRFYNPYSVIVVNPKMHPHVQFGLAMKYADFLVSSEGQRIIGTYRAGGETLFTPANPNFAGRSLR